MRARVAKVVLPLLFAVAGACGTVSAPSSDGGTGGAGGATGAAGHPGAAGAGGAAAGHPGAGGAAAEGGAGGPACISTNANGFAWNISNPCPHDGGVACYAACMLNGAQYVGCVSDSTIGTQCYRSCSDCP